MNKEIKHPMILAIGEEEFKKDLDAQPKYYTPDLEGNFKPIGMQIIWESRYVVPDENKVTEELQAEIMTLYYEAQYIWQEGGTRQAAMRAVMPKILKIIGETKTN